MKYITERPYGFVVRFEKDGKTVQRFFNQRALGGQRKALAVARKFIRDCKLPPFRSKRRAQKNSKSGILGVCQCTFLNRKRNTSSKYWVAIVKVDGKLKYLTFFPRKYGGIENAKKAAIKARKEYEATLRKISPAVASSPAVTAGTI